MLPALTAIVPAVPVPAVQPEVHLSGDQLAPLSEEDSIVPLQRSEPPVTCTPTIAEE